MAKPSSTKLKDPISPEHYRKGKIEPIDFIESQGMGFHEANCVKYITRYKYKNGLEDLQKAKWYLERLISFYQEQSKK
jgi:hypothetical protein